MSNNRVDELPVYFKEAERGSEGLDEHAKGHYDRKLELLRDPSVVSKQWESINYFLKAHGMDIRGKTVLDVGCGTGYTSIYFAAAGADLVIGMDPRTTKMDAFRSYTKFLPEEIRSRIEMSEIRSEQIVWKDHFDVVYAQEAISHIVDDRLFETLFNSIKPNGLLLISDGNNELCAHYRKEIWDYWDRIENGPPGQAGHHFVQAVYKDLRKDIISELLGNNIDNARVEELAQNTSYLHGDELKRAVEDSASTGKHPNSPYKLGTPPIHPIGGYFMEKTFNPYQLKEDLLNVGFSKCRLYGGVGLSKPKYLRPLISMIPLRYKFMRSHDFKVVAIK